jgi:hypothetical protein
MSTQFVIQIRIITGQIPQLSISTNCVYLCILCLASHFTQHRPCSLTTVIQCLVTRAIKVCHKTNNSVYLKLSNTHLCEIIHIHA